MDESRRSHIKRRCEPPSLLEVISDLLEEGGTPQNLPEGVETIERVTVEAVRIKFDSKVDEGILSRIAREEGYSVEKGSFAPRITKRGIIIARVGSRSDIGGRANIFIYPFPPEMDYVSIYRKVLAEREGILDPFTGRINLEKFYGFNLKVIKLVSRYREEKYRNP